MISENSRRFIKDLLGPRGIRLGVTDTTELEPLNSTNFSGRSGVSERISYTPVDAPIARAIEDGSQVPTGTMPAGSIPYRDPPQEPYDLWEKVLETDKKKDRRRSIGLSEELITKDSHASKVNLLSVGEFAEVDRSLGGGTVGSTNGTKSGTAEARDGHKIQPVPSSTPDTGNPSTSLCPSVCPCISHNFRYGSKYNSWSSRTSNADRRSIYTDSNRWPSAQNFFPRTQRHSIQPFNVPSYTASTPVSTYVHSNTIGTQPSDHSDSVRLTSELLLSALTRLGLSGLSDAELAWLSGALGEEEYNHEGANLHDGTPISSTYYLESSYGLLRRTIDQVATENHLRFSEAAILLKQAIEDLTSNDLTSNDIL